MRHPHMVVIALEGYYRLKHELLLIVNINTDTHRLQEFIPTTPALEPNALRVEVERNLNHHLQPMGLRGIVTITPWGHLMIELEGCVDVITQTSFQLEHMSTPAGV